MIGITLEEMFEALKNNHEVEFEYCDQSYIIQPEQNGMCTQLIIGIESDGDYIIASSSYNGDIDNECINALLNEPCFNGKSFNDISDAVTIVSVY